MRRSLAVSAREIVADIRRQALLYVPYILIALLCWIALCLYVLTLSTQVESKSEDLVGT